MLDLTYLSPRESFLLGLCFGEYETKRSSDPEARFISVIRDRLLPFVDTLGQSVTSYLTLEQIPTDVVWRSCNGWNWGRAKSRPDTVYNCFGTIESEVKYAGSITADSWRPGRKSLIELLIHSLAPFMCMSLKDHFSFGDAHDPSTIASKYFEYWSSYAFQGHEVADAKAIGKEIPAAIRRTLDEQIDKCGDKRFFGVGKSFGTLIAKVESFSDRTLDEEFDKNDEYRKLWHAVYPAVHGERAYRHASRGDRPQKYDASEIGLLDFEIVKNNQYASKALDDLVLSLTDKTELWHAEPRTVANRLQMDCWIAVGEILGILRGIDGAAELSDKFLARANIQVADPPDRIEQCLRLGEWNLSQKSGEEGSPESVVRATSPAIEALTKLVWPNENLGKGELRVFFDRKLEERLDELHKRFTYLARLLYLNYRNPGQHELGSFRCSYEEARFFVAGLRALLDIYRQIMAKG